VRTIVASCLALAGLLSAWSAFTLHSLLIGRIDGEGVFIALAASAVATVAAAFPLSISISRRREWSVGYLASSLAVASISIVVGTWAWVATY
jgi:hypothetical protein